MPSRFAPYAAPLAFLLALLIPFVVSGAFAIQLAGLLPYAIAGLALNVVVGYAGILHLGIMAFFTIGVFVGGLASYNQLPFQYAFLPAVLIAVTFACGAGFVLGLPTLRLRGDYLALVTLGFGEMMKDTIVNLPEISNGIRGFGPIYGPKAEWWSSLLAKLGFPYATMYFVNLLALAIVWVLLSNVERSRWGRAWVALREDELAATAMGVNEGRMNLAAFALCGMIAGLGGALVMFTNENTLAPGSYDFNKSILVLAGVILGGIGNRAGVLLGVLLIFGFDQIGISWLGDWVKRLPVSPNVAQFLAPTQWNMMLYGLILILMMRFRPEGILPERRLATELDRVPEPPADAPSEVAG